MNIEKVHTVVSLRQKPWFHNILTTIVKKVKQTIILYKISAKVRLHVSLEKQWNVRKMLKVQFVRKDDEKIWMNKQSKLCFIGVHYSDENYDPFNFKPKHVKMTKPCLSWFLNLTTVETVKIWNVMKSYNHILNWI